MSWLKNKTKNWFMGSALLIILMVICFGVIIFVIALIQENRRTIAKQKKKIRENTFNEEDIYRS